MIENGQHVKIHYKGTLEDGTVFDTSEGREPLEFQLGSGMVIPGFEQAVSEMTVGETRTVTIPSVEAYGERRDDMVGQVPRSDMPEDLTPEVGMMLEMHSEERILPALIVGVTDDHVMIDANHPLAGLDLTFELTVVEAS